VTELLAGVLGLLAGGVMAGVVVLFVHERREFARLAEREDAAEEREERAIKRHGDLSKQLSDNRALTLAAVNQRGRLELRVDALEVAHNDHADHLESLGIRTAARVRVGGEP
jgi:hypothetical protein